MWSGLGKVCKNSTIKCGTRLFERGKSNNNRLPFSANLPGDQEIHRTKKFRQ